ncbi:MAG: hypothetical protein A2Y33_14580 [Spirochaetes bacterium GWF1_51_8]|nr:MAG: hypothetical protein A2Y33_14580 [Spirochaetes bacterium GWF1_51_8]
MAEEPKKTEEKKTEETFRVSGAEILDKINEIIKEGNARRIVIKNEKDEVLVEFPLSVGAVGVVLAPLFAAVGAIAALVTKCTITVEKRQ